MPTCVGPRIRLALFGCTNRPFFHIIVTEGRRKRNTGRAEQVNHNFLWTSNFFHIFCRLVHLIRCRTLAAKNSFHSTSKESSEWACQCGGMPLHYYYYYYYYFVKVLVGGWGHAHKARVQDPRIGESLAILLKAVRTVVGTILMSSMVASHSK